MVDGFITQTFTISNHPIKRLNKMIQSQYAAVLGVLLCSTTDGNSKVRFVFETWVASIFGSMPLQYWNNQDIFCLKKALNPDSETAFSPKCLRILFFDYFYLQEKARLWNIEKVFEKLCKIVDNGTSRNIADYVYRYFNGQNTGYKLSLNLRCHRNSHMEFCRLQTKRVLVVATMSAGKSTFINAMIGEKINKVKATACTSKIRYIYNVPNQYGASVKLDNELIYTENVSLMRSENADTLAIGFKSSRLANKKICIIDTPGVNYSGDESHGRITRGMVSENNYDLLLFVSNAQQFLINDEQGFIEFVLKNCKKQIVFVLNQCDMFSPKDDSIKETMTIFDNMIRKIVGKQLPIVPLSGLGAYHIRHAERMGKFIDEDDLYEYNETKKKFVKPYYNLPSYITDDAIEIADDNSLIDNTGITIIENIISKL